MKIGKREIGRGRTFLIAEIGGNHEGDFDTARRMVREAAASGADAVKFQVFEAGKLVNPKSPVNAYSGASHEKQWERFKKMEFSLEQYKELKKSADREKVLFMASVFDPEWLKKLDPLLAAYKVASGDMTYASLLSRMKGRNKPVLVSTGASTLDEIGWLVQFMGQKNLALLHCVCAYPAPHDQMNLRTIPALSKKFGVPTGLSDHSLGLEACLAATALGAVILEKHFTLDPSNPVGDHKHSLTPQALAKLVASVRVIEKTLGKPRQDVFDCEKRSRGLVRRSLHSARDLSAGNRLRAEDIVALRPLEGIPAESESRMLGRRLKKGVHKGQPLLERHLAR